MAGLHQACLEQPDAAAGQSFNSVCTQALTLRGYAELVARHFGHEPRLEFVPWDEFVTAAGRRSRPTLTLDHIGRAPMFSMDKARTVLGFVPKHSVTDTVLEAIDAWVAAPADLRRAQACSGRGTAATDREPEARRAGRGRRAGRRRR